MLGFDGTYIVFRNDWNNNGGGVMVVVDKQLQPMKILMVSNLEVIIVQVTINKHIMYIVSIYKLPQIGTQQWITKLKCILDIYKDCKVCVVGDLNENLFHDGIKAIHNCFTDADYLQDITMPTHDSGTLIDHLYTHNVCQAGVTTEVIDCYYSDHDIFACAIDVKHDIC